MGNCKKTSIGGQALIEGIMMLGPKKSAIAVRRADGQIELKTEEITRPADKCKIFGLPFIRGIIGLFDSLRRGFRALDFASSIAISEIDEEPSRFEKWLSEKFGEKATESLIMGVAGGLGILISVSMFIFLPTLLAGFLDGFIGSGFLRNITEGILRILIFFVFMLSISLMKDMKRVFSYHGAEHKSIFCYEAGLELTVENVKKFSKEHPRCGTSFMFSVMIVSILVFSVVSWSDPLIRMALRLLLLPVVVGISYEINRFVGRHDNFVTRIIRAPGLWFQNFTTFEPDDGMIEVAITALREVIPENSEEDKW